MNKYKNLSFLNGLREEEQYSFWALLASYARTMTESGVPPMEFGARVDQFISDLMTTVTPVEVQTLGSIPHQIARHHAESAYKKATTGRTLWCGWCHHEFGDKGAHF